MSHRPIQNKKLRRLQKSLRQKLPARFNLIDYLKLHGHAQTTGEAKKIILDGRVRSESHKLGITQGLIIDPKLGEVRMGDVVDPIVDSRMKENLIVLGPK